MYLFERLIGVFTYAFLLLAVYFAISFSKRENLGKILFIYTILLSVMAFFFVPNNGSDLYRTIPIMHAFSQHSLEEIYDVAFEANTPMTVLYMYVIGQANIDGFLPAITAFFFFKNVFYIIKRSAMKYNATSRQAALVLLFFMSTGMYMEVISGIRSMLAFSIIAICFYKEILENKSIVKNLVWYTIAALIHPAAMVLVVIRVFFLLIQNEKSAKENIYNILIIAFLGAFILTIGNTYLMNMLDKADGYINEGVYDYFWEYVIGSISLMAILIVQINTYISIKKDGLSQCTKKILKFSCLLSIFIIVFCMEYNTFHRFTIFNSIISLPLMMNVLQKSHSKDYKRSHLKLTLCVLSFVMLFLACSRGNLCSLKFFIF